jgi:predicted peptidase
MALVAFLWLLSSCGTAPATPVPQTGVHLQAKLQLPEQMEGQPPSHTEMDYLLWLPEGYGQDPAQQWPLILFLHGAGGEENDSQFVMSYGLPEVLYQGDQPEEFPFIVVSPQAYPNVPWWEGDTLAILNALLDEVMDTYQVDPARVYLTGLSMGGYGSWWLATAYPERFAAMVSVSGSGYRTPTPADEETVCRLREVPTWAIHGAQDAISDPMANKLHIFSLEACGGEVKWTLYPDAGHGETYVRAYRDPEVYQWLLEHTKP